MHATHQRGAIAEAEIALAAIKIGIGVFRPAYDGERYDLIFDFRPKLARVQCKAATRYDDIIIVRCRSGRRTREGILMRAYTCAEIDAFAAYCPEVDRCFYLPIEKFEGRKAISLRLGPSRNNQRLAMNWAEDYAFENLALNCAAEGP